MEHIIAQGLAALGLEQIPPDSPRRLARYGQLLLEKNQVMNLTAITDPGEVARLHMLDCAPLLRSIDPTRGPLIDVGTGAGFPGLVLKILCPALPVTLLDAQQKRLDFLSEVAADLELEGVTFLHARGEEAGHMPELRESFAWATARAVADLRVLGELCLPLVAPGGLFLAMKSVDSGDEVNAAGRAISKLGGRLRPAWDYTIPGSAVTHRVVEVEKVSPTPAQYPRRWAKITKSPL